MSQGPSKRQAGKAGNGIRPEEKPATKKGLKNLIRVVAFDDGAFRPRSRQPTPLVGVVYRTDNRVEGIVSTTIGVDALDSTKKIISSLRKSKFLPQISFILLDGVNFAGFNIVDVGELHRKLHRPVLAVFRKMPNLGKINLALKRFPDANKRISLIKKAGEIHKTQDIHFQCHGTDAKTARQVIKKCRTHSNLPEPLRLAHLIASGITRGESTRP